MDKPEKPLLLLFDGHALIHRAFHALPPLTVSKTGEPTGAVYGFIRMLFKVLGDFKPVYCAITFDRPAPTFRHVEFKDYKAHRPETPDELKAQFGRVHQIVDALNITAFEMDGYEADDLLGTISRQASGKGLNTIIVTGDADALQLVTPDVKVLLPQRNFSDTILYDEEAVQKRYGISPQQTIDYKGLKGDPSDNIPGVHGIGEKTAAKLIQQFSSVEGIYQHIDEVTPVRIREILKEQEEQAKLSRRLATIDTRVPVTFEPECCQVRGFNREKLVPLFREMEFFTLLDKLPDPAGQKPPEQTVSSAAKSEEKHNLIDSPAAFDNLIARLSGSNSFTIHLVIGRRESFATELAGIAFAVTPEEAFYLPLGGQAPQMKPEQILGRLHLVMADTRISKTAHGGKEAINILRGYGIELNNLEFDTMIAAYLLGEKSLALTPLALSKLGSELPSSVEPDSKKALIQVDVTAVAAQACREIQAIGRLRPVMQKEMEEQGLYKLFTEVEMPLVTILAGMERNGVALDTGLMRQMSQSTGLQSMKLEQEIYDSVGHKFNISSPQQLGGVLFGELHLPGAKKTKSGYSTDASVMEGLKDAHPVIRLVTEYRQLMKLRSTYIDALPAMVNPKTGRIHTSFNQTVTATGRLSSSEPNLQNIPVRADVGRQIRKAFIAEPPSLLISGDYSQIELRVLAHVSQDSRLLAAFRNDEDIHAATASEVFSVPASGVTPDMRRIAKVVNFGVIYGMSDYGLEQATELTRSESVQFISSYFQRYPGVKEYLDSTRKQAKEKGYVQTLLGRRRYVPELNASNRQVREAAERMAINMPLQGTAADITKLAMIDMQREIDRRGLRSKMILQVHDELLFEVPPSELEQMKLLTAERMSQAMKLDVPLKVDIKVGANWGEMKYEFSSHQ